MNGKPETQPASAPDHTTPHSINEPPGSDVTPDAPDPPITEQERAEHSATSDENGDEDEDPDEDEDEDEPAAHVTRTVRTTVHRGKTTKTHKRKHR